MTPCAAPAPPPQPSWGPPEDGRAGGHALPVELLVGVLEPAQGRLVLAAQATVEVDDGVVTLHVLVQGVLQIPGDEAQTRVRKPPPHGRKTQRLPPRRKRGYQAAWGPCPPRPRSLSVRRPLRLRDIVTYARSHGWRVGVAPLKDTHVTPPGPAWTRGSADAIKLRVLGGGADPGSSTWALPTTPQQA